MSQIYAPGLIAGPPATFMGPYNAATSYSVGQAVSSCGSSYVSLIAANTGNNPATSPASWGLLAAAGSAGASLNTTLTFAAAGSQIVTHGLNTLAPIVQASVASGATRWSGAAIDANNYQITASGPMVASFTFLGGATSAAPATTSTTNLATGLTNYWPMDEGSGASFIDAIAANNLTAQGVTWSGGLPLFSGAGNGGAYTTTQPAPLDNSTTPFSISMWVNISSISASWSSYLLCSTYFNTSGYCFGFFSGGSLGMIICNGSAQSYAIPGGHGSFTTGIRQNLIVTYDGVGNFTFYVNGTLLGASPLGSLTISAPAAGVSFWLMAEPDSSGPSASDNNAPGTMDHLRIYNRVLAAGDIAAIQAGGN